MGRTGAGKSSLVAALLRLVEPHGDILISGSLTRELGLHKLRKSISVIPQDPQLLKGPLRRSLDPFDQREDREIWKVLQMVRTSKKSLIAI